MNLYLKLFKSILFSCLFLQILCLYEDQVGKFDWRKSFVGSLKFAKIIDRGGSKRLFVATKENVLASIDLKSGDLKWRHILEKDHQGGVHLLHGDEDLITTVTGISTVLIRGWHPDRGFLNFQWSLPATAVNNLKEVLWWVQNERLYQIVLIADSHVEVTGFNLRSGTKAKPSFTIPASWVSHVSSCAISNGVLLCASETGVVTALPFLDPEPKPWKPFSLQANEHCTLESLGVSSAPAFIAIQPLTLKKTLIVLLDGNNYYLKPNIPQESDVSLHSLAPGKHAVVEVTQQGKSLVVSGSVVDGKKSPEQLTALSTSVEVPSIITGASLPASHCIIERDKTISCDLLVNTHDDTIVYFNTQSKKISWLREEALASIVSVQLIDLGVSEEEAAIEKEFNNKESSFFGMFYRRISSQLHQLQSFVYTISGMLDQPSEPGQTANLVRDEFGLHKIIVAVSKVGKLFGIDNLSGNILWTQLVKDVVPFSLADTSLTVPFFVQRTARHFPSPAMCTVIFQDAITGNGVLFSFNPITGEPLGDGQRRLSYKIQQTLMLHQKNEDNLNGILLVDDKRRVHPYPESTLKMAIAVAPSTYLFIANPSTGLVTGFSVHYSPKEGLTAQTIWEVNVGKGIISVEAKNPLEKVHSQGRVLSDRSVLYKYINPNLIAVTTHHQDPVHKSVVNLWLIDAVSGAVAYSTSHKRATPPVHVIHSENWVVYSYFNEKFRRTEIATLELYEGKNQRNTTAFTAAEAALIVPQVGKQAYILPASIETMRETITEKGITSKHVLVAMSTGGILEIPWPFLDPRRPATVTQEMREEGVIPYIPELPIPSEAIINYNQTLLRLRGIHTTPSGLESTSLVFAYGLDLFYTRISPSKTFDLLKEDFDYFLIMVVLTGLSIAAYATKHLAGRKALKQAWK